MNHNRLVHIMVLAFLGTSVSFGSTLVGFWNFEDGAPGGYTADLSGVSPALDGQLQQGAQITTDSDPGRNKVLKPNGGGVLLGYDSKLYYSDSITVQYWTRKQNPSEQWKYIVGQNGNGPRHFNMNGGMVFAMQTSDSGWNPINVWLMDFPEPQTWHHFVGTYNGEYLYGYIDGVPIASVYRGGTISSHNNYWSIGLQWNGMAGGGWDTNGCTDWLDDVAVWTGYATPEAVQGLYNGTYTVFDAPIEAPGYLGEYPQGDLDKNGFVNLADAQQMASLWLEDCTQIDCGRADMVQDDTIRLDDAALLAANWQYKEGTGKYVTVEPLVEIPTFRVDGDFDTYGAFSHNWPHPSNVPVKGFADTGTIFQDFGGYSTRDAWLSTNPDKWDFSTVNTRMTFLVDPVTGDPDVLAMPWTHIDAPDWWLNDSTNQNELEMMVDSSGTASYYYSGYAANPGILPRSGPYPSLASQKWREDMAVALESFIEYLYLTGQMENIGGFKLTGLGTGEWYSWSSGRSELAGYGVRTQEAFRQWLREKYNNDVNALRASWNQPSVTFDSVGTPSRMDRRAYSGSRTFRDPGSYMDVIDFELFYDELIVDTIDYFAGVIKRKTNDSKAVGAFYGFMYEFSGNPEFGHNAMRKYIDCDNLDFIWVTASYQNRLYVSGADLLRSPGYSVNLHDTLWFNSNDTATFLTSSPDIINRAAEFGYTDTLEKNKRMFLRSAGFNVCNGFMQDWFALHDDWYNDAGLMNAVGQVNGIYGRSENYDRTSASEVLIVSDEVSCSYVTYSQGWNPLLQSALADPQLSLTQMGTPADHILLDDIAVLPNPDQYKLVVFLNCYHMNNAQRALVNGLKGNDRVLMFCYAPGYFNGNSASESQMESVVAMNLTVGSETLRKPRVSVQNDHPLGQALLSAGVSTFGPGQNICRRIYVDDAAATRLGRDPSYTSQETMAIRDLGNWESIYVVTAQMPSAAYREIARYAGCHIYNERSDSFYANQSYVCIHPNHSEGSSQSRTIVFPQPVDVYDAETETLLQSNTTSYTRSYYGGETRMYRYE